MDKPTSFFKFMLDRHHLGGHTEFYLYALAIGGNAEIIAWPQDVYWLEGKKYLSASGYARACGVSVLEAVEKLAQMPSLDVWEDIPELSDEDRFAIDYMSRWFGTSELGAVVSGKSVTFMQSENGRPGYDWIYAFAWSGDIVSVKVRDDDFRRGCLVGYEFACALLAWIRDGCGNIELKGKAGR